MKSPVLKGASKKGYPQSYSVTICPCGFAKGQYDSTLYVTSDWGARVSNEHLVSC